MSVIVRGLIMPDDCKECKVSCETESGLHCLLVDDGDKRGWKKIESGERPDWCPLRPLPEKHGRLIDADALLKQKGDCYDHGGHLLYAVGTGNILCAPTIVKAQGDD